MRLNIHRHSFIILFFFAVLLAGNNCLADFKYEGDGVFHDYGKLASNDRYVLELGEIDLSRRSEATITIGDLPNTQTLGLYLYFDVDEIYGAKADLWQLYSKVEVHLIIKVVGSEDAAFEYKGVLFEDGFSGGEYYRKGLKPVETTFRGAKCIGFTIPYYFDEKIDVFGVKTPFYKNHKRIISLKVLKPIVRNDSGLRLTKDAGIVADLIISGGDW